MAQATLSYRFAAIHLEAPFPGSFHTIFLPSVSLRTVLGGFMNHTVGRLLCGFLINGRTLN